MEKRHSRKSRHDIYIDSSKIEDNYYVFCLSIPNTIYSHMIAFYFHGLSIKAPNDKYDITIRKTYNSKHLKNYEIFYVRDDIYELGITEVETTMRNKVRRMICICDIIRSKNRMDLEHIKYSVREYVKRKESTL